MWATERRIEWAKKCISILTLLLICCSAAACVTLPDPESTQDYNRDRVGVIGDDQTLGQTFVSRRPRLNGIVLWLEGEPAGTAEGLLTINLYHAPGDPDPVWTQRASYSQFVGTGVLQLSLPPQPGPAGQSYYLTLATTGGTVRARGRSEDSYPHGQLYVDGQPVYADLAFRLSYDYDLAAMLSDLAGALSQGWLALPLAVTLLVPGWLLLDLSGLRRRFDGWEQITLSVSLSLAIVPICLLWTSILGLRLSRTTTLLVAGFLTAIVVTRFVTPRLSHVSSLRATLLPPRFTLHASSLALLAVFIFSLVLRLAMVRDLAAPAWVDSIHHATITRLIMEQGAIPSTYDPYIPIDATKYHAGFHAAAAVFQWLSGLELAEGLLLYGQALNALAVLAVYLLTTTLTRDRTAGVTAALVAGVMTPMPAYYASWGRYTQLAGLLILPAVLALGRLVIEPEEGGPARRPVEALRRWLAALRRPAGAEPLELQSPTEIQQPAAVVGPPIRVERLRAGLLAALAVAGLFLVHYRVLGFMVCLLLAYGLSQLRFDQAGLSWLARHNLGFVGLVSLGSILLTLPWLWPALRQFFLPVLQSTAGQTIAAFSDFSWRFLTTAWGLPALILAGLGVVWGILWFRRSLVALAVWAGLLMLLGNLGALGVPGGSMFNNTSVEIALFMPIAAAAGFFVSEVLALARWPLPRRVRLALDLLVVLGGAVAAIGGAQKLLPILNPTTFLYRAADRPALQWVAENIPVQETILINPFSWGYGLFGGNDGGFWITPLAGRRTLPPPVLYGVGNPDEVARINQISQQVLNSGGDANLVRDLMRAQGIRYVYIGSRGGALSTAALQSHPDFETLYNQDGVWVFRLRTP
jgi:hypothetical protein